MTDARKPYKRLEEKALPPAPVVKGAVPEFVPAIEVAVDLEKTEKTTFKLFVDDVGGYAGVNSDGTFVSSIRLSFSDYLGDRRAFFIWDTLAGYSNVNVIYFNLKRRLQWGLQAYDNRTYFTGVNEFGEYVSTRRFSRETGLSLLTVYPLSRYTRVESVFGFLSRSIDQPYVITNVDGSQGQVYFPREDNRSRSASASPTTGRATRASDPTAARPSRRTTATSRTSRTAGPSARTSRRRPAPTSRSPAGRTSPSGRSGASPPGSVPSVYAFGGLDTLRGYDYRALIGNKILYLNSEFRFPLIDVLVTGIGLKFGGVRGRFFFDIGAA